MENIRMIRAKTGMTQEQFSRVFGIPKRTIQNWERCINTPPHYVVQLLGKAVDDYLKTEWMFEMGKLYAFFTLTESGERCYFDDGEENIVLVQAGSPKEAEEIIMEWIDSDYVEILKEYLPASVVEKLPNHYVIIN